MGFSPAPARRLRQHNGEVAGGDAPRAGRPWELVLVVYGFRVKERALAFESAWQRPHASRYLARAWGTGGYGHCSGRTTVAVRLAALAMLLEHGAWAESALIVRVCVPEACARALRPVRRVAARLTCGPWEEIDRRKIVARSGMRYR